MSALAEQIDALLALNAKGAVSHPVPALAVELLERARDTLSALPPVDGLEVVANLPYRLRYAGATLKGDLGQMLMDAAEALSQASSVIAGLKEANEALMRERTNMIVTHRESIDRLTQERDDARAEIDAACNDLRSFMTTFVRENFPDNKNWKPLSDLLGMLSQMDNASTIARDYRDRISSLEEQNKRLSEALGSAYEHIEQLSELLKIIKNHWIDYDHVFSIAVHEADEFLAARQALEDHNG